MKACWEPACPGCRLKHMGSELFLMTLIPLKDVPYRVFTLSGHVQVSNRFKKGCNPSISRLRSVEAVAASAARAA